MAQRNWFFNRTHLRLIFELRFNTAIRSLNARISRIQRTTKMCHWFSIANHPIETNIKRALVWHFKVLNHTSEHDIFSYLIYLIKVFVSFYFIVAKLCASMRSFLRVVTIYAYIYTYRCQFTGILFILFFEFVVLLPEVLLPIFSFFLSQSFSLSLFISHHHRHHRYGMVWLSPAKQSTARHRYSTDVILLFLILLWFNSNILLDAERLINVYIRRFNEK